MNNYDGVRFSLKKTAPGFRPEEIDPFKTPEGFRFDDLLVEAIIRRAAQAAIRKCAEIDKAHGSEFSKESGGAGDFGCIVEFDQSGNGPSYRLCVDSPVQYPNNWAEGKLTWLKMLSSHHRQPCTSPMARKDFVDFVCTLVSTGGLEASSLMQADGYMYDSAGQQLASTNELSNQSAMLLSMGGVVPFYGAFCYECVIAISIDVGSTQRTAFSGVINISFSGAKQKRDLQFAMEVFKAMHDEFTGGPFSSLVYGYGFEIKGWPDTVEDEYFAQLWQGTMRELGYSI
ncbi:hypothetical protein J6X73_01575 [Candidatus Saccharibacteria bacterium]|nr:hypothetical protein [Candidatus Saccharibacteria bacterium]